MAVFGFFYWTVSIIWQSETQRHGIQNNHPNSHKLIYQCYDKLYNNTQKISHVKSREVPRTKLTFQVLICKIMNKPYRKTNIKSTYIYELACLDCKLIFKRISKNKVTNILMLSLWLQCTHTGYMWWDEMQEEHTSPRPPCSHQWN